jgi:hypothetical protein
MNISKPFRIVIGLGTLWYIAYPLLFIGGMLLTMGLMPFFAGNENSLNSSGPFIAFPFFGLIFPLHFCTIFLGFGLIAFYLIHVIKNTKADETIRIILALGNFFMPFISMPIYYYLYIWLENPPTWAAAKLKQIDEPTGTTIQ